MNKNIVLIGMPGCGKSTIGYMLSKKLSMNCIDVDKYIEESEKETISSMFEKGEKYFRDIESKYIEELSNLNSTIIATGGGVVKKEGNMLLLKKNSVIMFINRKIKDIFNDVDDSTRPLLKDKKEKLYELYEERLPLYKKYCDVEVENVNDLNAVVDKICEIYIKRG